MSGFARTLATVLAAMGLALAGLAVAGVGDTEKAGPTTTRSTNAQPASAGTAAVAVPAGPVREPLPAVQAPAPCPTGLAGDVNGDRHAESVVGEPFDSMNQTGAVHVFYGTTAGLVADGGGTALDDQLLTQATRGVPGSNEPGDTFGGAALLADFNADDCADLAVGVPGENANTGRVVILYGSRGGVSTSAIQSLSEGLLFGARAGRSGERFGDTLASGDFDGDGITDLVVGAPGENVSPSRQVGGVTVVYGAADGLGTGPRPSALLTQATPGVPGNAEEGDLFGEAVTGADVDGDDVDDLVVGVPMENDAGFVHVLPGRLGAGLGAEAGASYSQNTPGVPGLVERGDRFGAALAAGDVTGDGSADLAVGAPGENGTASGPEPRGKGAVLFLPGSSTGLSGAGSQFWSQNSFGVLGVGGNHDNFGASLVMARLDNGRSADLAIGVPFDDVRSIPNAGSVNVLLGTASGLSVRGAGGARFHQNTPRIVGVPEPDDQFGRSVAAPRIQTPGQGSLVIGVPTEDLRVDDTGLVHQLQTFEFGPNPAGSRVLQLETLGVQGSAEGQDLVGFTIG